MRLVIVGASLAGLRAAQAARSAGHEGGIVMVGEEPHLPYTRPPLSKELLQARRRSRTRRCSSVSSTSSGASGSRPPDSIGRAGACEWPTARRSITTG